MAGPSLPAALRVLAESQSGVVSRHVLRLHGVTRNGVHHQVIAQRWQTYGPHAVLLQNAAPSRRQQEWIAVTNCGRQGGMLAGPTAAALLGLQGYESREIHLLIPDSARIALESGVVAHRTRRPLDDAAHPTRQPAMTRLERSLLDAACWTAHDRDACALLAAAVQQRLTTAGRLQAEVAAAPVFRRRRLFRLVLDDIDGGAHSLAELDFARLCRRCDLPAPLRQAVRTDSRGRRRFLDVELPFRSGRGTFAVEIDGALHLLPRTYWDDMARSNEITIAGTPVLRFPTLALRLEPDAVMAQVRRMYESLPGRRTA